MANIEALTSIKFTDNNGNENTFTKGDSVICCLKDKTRYKGILAFIGQYQDNDGTEPFNVICIDTSKSKMSYSSEIVKFTDIDYICKNPLSGIRKVTMSKDWQDRKTFVGMLCGLGYDRKQIETVYDRLKNVMKSFDISVEKGLACAMYALENKCSFTVPLKDLCGIDIEDLEKKIDTLEKTAKECSAMAVKSFRELIEAYQKGVKAGEDMPPFTDILKLVQENWKNMGKEERKEITELLAGVEETSAE